MASTHPKRGGNDYAGLDMAGKTAVILVNDPDFGAETLEGPFNGKAMTIAAGPASREEAAQGGGALIIHDTEPASHGWNVVESSWSGLQAYASREDNPPPMTQLNGWVQKSVAERLFAAAGKDFGELAAAAREEGFAPVALGLTASTSFRNDIRTLPRRTSSACCRAANGPTNM